MIDALVFNTVTGDIIEALPYVDYQFNTPLDDSGQGKISVPLTDDSLEHVDVELITKPWLYSLAFATGDNVPWAGPIVDRAPDASSDNAKLSVSAGELWQLLKTRPLYAQYPPTASMGDLTLSAASEQGLAVAIVKYALSMPGGALPIVLPDDDPGPQVTATYDATSHKTAADALLDLMKTDGGPDIRFDAQFTSGGQRIEWVMHVGYPLITQPGTDLAFDHPSPQVRDLTQDEDATSQATTYVSASQGVAQSDGTQTPMISVVNNDELLALGYPAMYRVDTTHSNEINQDSLDRYATALANLNKYPVTLRPFSIQVDDPDYPLGSYSVGSTCVLSVVKHVWIPDGDYLQRITDIAVATDTVTLTVSEEVG